MRKNLVAKQILENRSAISSFEKLGALQFECRDGIFCIITQLQL